MYVINAGWYRPRITPADELFSSVHTSQHFDSWLAHVKIIPKPLYRLGLSETSYVIEAALMMDT